MKKFVIFAAACLLSLSINAQSFKTIGQQKAERSTVAFQAPENMSSRRALAENQFLCGYYTTDDLAEYGLGVTSLNEVCKAATEFGPQIHGGYAGFKVVGMRVGLCYAVSDFGVFISKVGENSYIDFKEKAVGTGTAGWNTIMFDESEQFELSSSETYLVGFSYKQKKGSTNDCYPLSLWENSSKVGNFMFFGTLSDGQGWYNIGTSYGALSVQLIVEGQLSSQKAIIEGVDTDKFGKIGSQFSGVISITNMGKDAISSLGFNYYIDDAKVGDATITTTIASTKSANINLSIPVPADLAIGRHTVKVELAAINGAAPTGEVVNNNPTLDVKTYSDTKPRQKYLIEHVTSWTCTYCYLGYNLLRQMESDYNDIAWVAVHGNLHDDYPDPYNFEGCDYIMYYLSAFSFPSAALNRITLADDAVAVSIGGWGQNPSTYAPQVHQTLENYSAPSLVSLDIQSSFDASSRKMNVTVKGTGVAKASAMLNDYAISIYLTEAGLVGRQYSSGSWQNSYEHNNTLRAVLTNVLGEDISWTGDDFTFTTDYTVPSDYKEENLSITAFVAPKLNSAINNLAVINCEKVKLDLTSTGISSVSTTNATEAVRYTLDGRQISAPQHGLNIVKMSDGTVKKVMVK